MCKLNEMYREFKKWTASAPKNFVCFWKWNLWAWTEPHHYYLSADILPIIGEYRIDEHGTLQCTSIMGGHDTFPYGTYIVCADRRVAARYRDDMSRTCDRLVYPQMPDRYTAISKSQVLIMYAQEQTDNNKLAKAKAKALYILALKMKMGK